MNFTKDLVWKPKAKLSIYCPSKSLYRLIKNLNSFLRFSSFIFSTIHIIWWLCDLLYINTSIFPSFNDYFCLRMLFSQCTFGLLPQLLYMLSQLLLSSSHIRCQTIVLWYHISFKLNVIWIVFEDIITIIFLSLLQVLRWIFTVWIFNVLWWKVRYILIMGKLIRWSLMKIC